MDTDKQIAISLSKDELHDIIKKAVTEVLTGVGIDAAHPIETQKDMQYVRAWRETSESVRGKAIVVAVGIVLAGACGIFWLGVKAIFKVQ